MANISASLVKELRDKTGAGMMDCKKALVEAEGDIEAAIDFLRKSGIAKAEKKSGRVTKEGKIISCIDGNKGSLIEALCETDFVATNEKFLNYVNGVAQRVAAMDGNGDVSEQVQESEKDSLVSMISTIGENMQIRRAVKWESAGKIASYLHQGGRIGVMVDVEGDCDQEFLVDICMHIAAFRPDYICPDCIPPTAVEREKAVVAAQMEGKSAEMIAKITIGKINKWHSDICLIKQPWIRDDKSSLAKINPNIKVKRFIRWEIGEEL